MRHLALWLTSLAGALVSPTAQAQDRQADVGGWEQFIAGLKVIPGQLLAKMPEDQRRDPQVQQEITRVVLASLAASILESIGSDGDHPAFVANQNLTLNYPQPNGDTVYRTTRVTPGGTYRLRGERGSLRMANLGQSGPMPGEAGSGQRKPSGKRGVLELGGLQVDEQGRFDVIISPVRPEGYKGDWWQLEPETTRLLLRTVKAGPSERDPTISIERVDGPAQRPRVPAEVLQRRLVDIPRAAALLPSMFVTAGAKLRSEGYVHKFKLVDAAQNGGLAGQSYYSTIYDLADDEALLISVRPPEKCLYRSIQLASEIEETIDWHNNQSGLNDTQAMPDRDGILRIVVSAKDPGVPNWLDTAGYASGIVEGRWMGCDSNPVPTIEKLPLSQLHARLPADTPRITAAERQKAVRDRRSMVQQRPLW